MDKLKDGWPLIIVTVLLNLAATFIVLGYSNNKDDVDGKASVEYVDKEISHVNKRIDKHEQTQDKTITNLKENQAKDVQNIKDQLKSIDDKLDIMIEKMN